MIGNANVRAHLPRFGRLMLAVFAVTAVLIPTRAQEPAATQTPPAAERASATEHATAPFRSALQHSIPPPIAAGTPVPIGNPYHPPRKLPGGPIATAAGYVDIHVNATPAPLPPAMRIAGFWTVRVARNESDSTTTQKGFMAFTFERDTDHTTWQTGVMMTEGDQFAQSFKVRFTDREGEIWKIDVDAGGQIAAGILKFFDDGKGARIAVQYPRDGSTAKRPENFKAKGGGFTIVKLKRLGKTRPSVPTPADPVAQYAQPAIGSYPPVVPETATPASSLPASVSAGGDDALTYRNRAKKQDSGAEQDGLSELQGRWRLKSVSQPAGFPQFAGSAAAEAVVTNDTWTTFQGGQPMPSRLIVVNAKSDPKTISFIYQKEDSQKPTAAQAIYRVSGNQLMLYFCSGGSHQRPTSYAEAAVAQVWQRIAVPAQKESTPPTLAY